MSEILEQRALNRKLREAEEALYARQLEAAEAQRKVKQAKRMLNVAIDAIRHHKRKCSGSISGKTTEAVLAKVLGALDKGLPLNPVQIATMAEVEVPVVREALRRLRNSNRVNRIERRKGLYRTVYTRVEHEPAAAAG